MPKENTGSTVCGQAGLEQIVRAPLSLASNVQTVNVARIAKSETRGQSPIQRQFRGEKKPRDTASAPGANQTYLLQVRQVNSGSCKSRVSLYQIQILRNVLLTEISFLTTACDTQRLATSLRLTCKKVRLICT